jgi:putative ABC transport system permease protein
MEVLLKIAYRNLRQHTAKTLIIGSLIAFGLVVLVMGNSLIATAEAGVRRLYSENFTGDVLIASARSESPGLFMTPGLKVGEPVPIIQDYRRLMSEIGATGGVRATVSQIKGFATAEIDGEGKALLQLFGVAPEEYLRMFPRTVEMVEGRFLQGDETGIVLSDTVARTLEESSGRRVHPGAKILLTSANATSGARIREVEVRGVARFPSEAPNLDFISYIDLASLRALSGMTRITDAAVDLTAQERSLLGATSESDLFGGSIVAESSVSTAARGEAELLGVLGDTSAAALYRELNPEAFHNVLLALEPGVPAGRMIARLNRVFAETGLVVRAYGWIAAAGGVAQMVSALKVVFNALVLVVAVVAVIIIMNTLVISITERIGEIGTMRAIGARRSFVRGMITFETLIISLVFGLAGAAVGCAALAALGARGIETSSVFLQVLFGGPVLKPVIDPASVALSLLVIPAIGLLASLDPVSVALRIEPVKAMGQR